MTEHQIMRLAVEHWDKAPEQCRRLVIVEPGSGDVIERYFTLAGHWCGALLADLWSGKEDR